MKDNTIKKLVFAALFAALSCAATMVIRIPTPIGGYIHAGDAVVLLSAFLLGPWWGASLDAWNAEREKAYGTIFKFRFQTV